MKRKVYQIRWFAIILMIILTNLRALSQEIKDQKPQPPIQQSVPSQPQEVKAPVLDEKSIKLFLDKIEVEGKLEKPQAVFIIPGTNPEIEDIKVERSFFEDIFRPIEKKGRTITRPSPDPDTKRKDVIPW